MYAVIRDRAMLTDAVKLFTFRASAEDFLAEAGQDDSAVIVALTENTEARIMAALREAEELSTSLRTGIHRRARGAA